MLKKGMSVAMAVAGIVSLACWAQAGDLMIWSPRTPAGGGSPGFIGSYMTQAAAVEYGPAATVVRDIDKPESRQDNYYQTETSQIQKYYSYDEASETLLLYQQNESTQTTVQRQESVIYYPTD